MRRLLPLLAVAAAACGGSTPPDGPPVLLIVLDALAASHVHHLGYGRETTPNLDALAAEGTTFTRCLAPTPYTLASIPSLLTGRLPEVHGVVDSDRVLSSRETTLAEALRARGWRTHAAVANLNGSAIYGTGQGFERYFEMFRAADQRERARAAASEDPEAALVELRRRRGDLHYPKAEEYLPVVAGWLADLDAVEVPFFYLHLLEPHAPYQPPEPFFSRWIDADYDGPFAAGDTETLLDALNGVVEHGERDQDAARDLYDANIAYGDHVLGELFALLRADGRWDETLVIVTADHGEAFWEHGVWGHNFTLFEEMVRVPLVVKFPASWNRAPRVCDELVSILDVVPSVCGWVGARVPDGLDGTSLDDALSAPDPARSLFLRTHHEKPDYGLATASAKVLLNRNLVPGDPGRRLVEYYDFEVDPLERTPLEPDAHPGGPALADELKRWVRVLSVIENPEGVGGPALTDEEQALLRKLGYL